MLDHSSEHSPTTKCPADSTEEARPTTVNTTSTVKKSNNRDKVAIGCTSKEKQFKNIDNAIENYRNNKSCKTSPTSSPASSILSSTSIYSSQSSPPNAYTSNIDSNLNHIKSTFNGNLNQKYLNTETEYSPRRQNKTFLSDKKKQSLAKLVASKQIDKNVNKFYHPRAIDEKVIEDDYSLSTCQNNSSQIIDYKHSRNNNIKDLQGLDNTEKINHIRQNTLLQEIPTKIPNVKTRSNLFLIDILMYIRQMDVSKKGDKRH